MKAKRRERTWEDSQVTQFIIQKVRRAANGAASEKTTKCRHVLFLEILDDWRKVTRPKAAGILCSMMAKKTIHLRDSWSEKEDVPMATPSTAAWTTSPMVADTPILPRAALSPRGRLLNWSTSNMNRKPRISEKPSFELM